MWLSTVGLFHLVVQFAVFGAFGAEAHAEIGTTRETLNVPVGETSSNDNFYGGWMKPYWGPLTVVGGQGIGTADAHSGRNAPSSSAATGHERAQIKPLISVNGCGWTEKHPVSAADFECDAFSVVPEVRRHAQTPIRSEAGRLYASVDDRHLVNSKLLSHCLDLLIVDPYPRPSDDRGDQCQKLRQEIHGLPVGVRLIYLLTTTYWSSVIGMRFWGRVYRRGWAGRSYWVGFGEFLAWGLVFFHGLSVFYG